ncbi:retrovirus-related pol polyprotein from transposon TNT 1-94 [Tanacetum coccineum]
MQLVHNLASNEIVRNLPKLRFERHFYDMCGLGSQGNTNNRIRNELSTTRVLELLHLDLFGPSQIQSYEGNFYTLMIVDDHSNYTWVVFVESKDDVLENKAYIVLNKETIRIEEFLNVTFDESLPEPKSSPSIEDDGINEHIVQDLNGSPSLQVNALDEGYPRSVKEVEKSLEIERTSILDIDLSKTYVKGMEVKQHCCFNEMKDLDVSNIIQNWFDFISDYYMSNICAMNKKFDLHLANIMKIMVLPDNQIGSPNSVLDEKMFENSSNDSDFNVELYLNDEKDNGDNVVIP